MATRAIPVAVGEIVNLTADVPLVAGTSYYVSVRGLAEIAEVNDGDSFPSSGHLPPLDVEAKAGSSIQCRGIELLSSIALTEVA